MNRIIYILLIFTHIWAQANVYDKKVLKDLNISSIQQETMLSLNFSGSVKVKQGELPKTNELPKRIYFDVSPAALAKGVPPNSDLQKNGLKRVRVGQFDSSTIRVVLELEDHAVPSFVLNEKIHRLEIKVSLPPSDTALSRSGATLNAAPKNEKFGSLKRVVIDAGHGGKDPGAIGKYGTKEKDVTLALAKRVRDMIHRDLPHVKVFMTREGDETVSLPARTSYANKVNADLFISIHVNSSLNRSAQGVETYYLNTTSDRYAKRLAARESGMTESQISDLEFILADLAMTSNVQESMSFGRVVQSSLVGHLQKKWQDVKDLGLKCALFYVLLGAKMPAILVETSFVSNHEDEKRLKDKEIFARGIFNGIKHFVERPVVALR